RGIGRAVADACERRGATVVRHGLSAGADVSEPRDVKALLDAVLAAHGRIDAVIHAAGVPGARAPAWDASPDAFARTLAVNVGGAFHVARELLRWAIPARARARFVALSSGIVESAVPDAAAYTASKHALEGLVRALAADAAGTPVTITAVRLGA